MEHPTDTWAGYDKDYLMYIVNAVHEGLQNPQKTTGMGYRNEGQRSEPGCDVDAVFSRTQFDVSLNSSNDSVASITKKSNLVRIR
jgi:hypothetical protein